MGIGLGIVNSREDEKLEADERDSALRDADEVEKNDFTDPPIQLDLLPLGPVPRNPPSSQLCFPWPTENGKSEAGSSGHLGATVRGFDVNWLPTAKDADARAAVSPPNNTVSSFQMDFSIYRGGNGGNKRDTEASGNEVEVERASRTNDEENGLTWKKLRLSKGRSAFLEETFKEHNTLNPVCRNPERERERAGSLCYFLKEGGGGAPGQFPDGRRIHRNFLCRDHIQLLWSFYYSHLEETGARPFRLVQAIPGDSKQLDYVTKLRFVEFRSPFRFSLEAGTKPKLLAMSCLCKGNPEAFLVSKGYKDAEYISLSLIARKLHLNTIIVIEQNLTW